VSDPAPPEKEEPPEPADYSKTMSGGGKVFEELLAKVGISMGLILIGIGFASFAVWGRVDSPDVVWVTSDFLGLLGFSAILVVMGCIVGILGVRSSPASSDSAPDLISQAEPVGLLPLAATESQPTTQQHGKDSRSGDGSAAG